MIMLPATVILINFCCVAHLYSMNSTELWEHGWHGCNE